MSLNRQRASLADCLKVGRFSTFKRSAWTHPRFRKDRMSDPETIKLFKTGATIKLLKPPRRPPGAQMPPLVSSTTGCSHWLNLIL